MAGRFFLLRSIRRGGLRSTSSNAENKNHLYARAGNGTYGDDSATDRAWCGCLSFEHESRVARMGGQDRAANSQACGRIGSINRNSARYPRASDSDWSSKNAAVI